VHRVVGADGEIYPTSGDATRTLLHAPALDNASAPHGTSLVQYTVIDVCVQAPFSVRQLCAVVSNTGAVETRELRQRLFHDSRGIWST